MPDADYRAIATKKHEMRTKVLAYNRVRTRLDCGGELAKHISLDVSSLAGEINTLAEWLKEHDPKFPKTWKPL